MSSENGRESLLRRVVGFVSELRPKPVEIDGDLIFLLNSYGEKGKDRSLLRHYVVFPATFKGYIHGTKGGTNLARKITNTASAYTPVTGEFVRNNVYGYSEEKITDFFKDRVAKEIRFAKKKGLPGDGSLLVRWMTVSCIKELINEASQTSNPDQVQSYKLAARKLFLIGVEESNKLSSTKIEGVWVNRIARGIFLQDTPDLMGDLNKFLTAPPTRE